jgi:Ca2+-binding RTX toxin-like protein
VLNTDTVSFRLRGGFPDASVLLAGGPFAPGATPESDGTSEIEIEFRGPVWAVVYGTASADAFDWGPGSTHQAGLNLNAGESGDQDVDVDITLSRGYASLLARGLGGDDTITTSPQLVSPASVLSGGGPGDDRVTAGLHAGGILEGEAGDDVLIGSGLADNLIGGPGNDRLVGGRGSDRFDLFDGARGRDLIIAGPGPDQINSRDSARDRVRCGPGYDRVTADRKDRLRGCELVSRPPRPPLTPLWQP